jgi:opacity protein-like surface antigen
MGFFKKSALCLLVITYSLKSFSQRANNRWFSNYEVGTFVGMSGYLGDLNKSDWFSKEPHFAYGAFGRYNLSSKFAIKLAYSRGSLTGQDANYSDRAFRNFSTQTTINDISGQIEYQPWTFPMSKLPHQFQSMLRPYIFVGIGMAYTNPKADMSNMIVIKPEIASGIEADLDTEYSKTATVVPFGLGLKYRVEPMWTIGLEAGFRFTFSDYIDGISQAANPGKTDRYKFSGVVVSYRFKRSPTKCYIP